MHTVKLPTSQTKFPVTSHALPFFENLKWGEERNKPKISVAQKPSVFFRFSRGEHDVIQDDVISR